MRALMFLALVAATNAVTRSITPLDSKFNDWVALHGKNYNSAEEFQARKEIFEETLLRIAQLELTEPSASFGLNRFADLTPEEFKEMYTGYKPMGNSRGVPVSNRLGLEDVASTTSFDWRTTKPYPVTAVKNQGQCGSCWAFSATEGIESARIMQGEKAADLAPQEIVSCDKVDMGCNGGDLPTAFSFVEGISNAKDIGLTLSHEYPYTSGTTGVTGKCKNKRELDGSTPLTKGTFAIPPCSTMTGDAATSCKHQAKEEPQLAAQLMKHGPISICVDASPWQTYTGGILKNANNCPGGAMDLDHCVQLVGFDRSGETPYWIVRNSWAEDWGEKGYIYLEMGKNMCGVADEPMFATDKVTEVAASPAALSLEFVGLTEEEEKEELTQEPSATPHYEDPNTTGSCQKGEVDVQIQGIKGKMCAPKCAFITRKCPTDVPAGVTAKPTCALQGNGGKYCALVCSPSTVYKSLRAGDAQCGKNASCKAISGTGICTFDS